MLSRLLTSLFSGVLVIAVVSCSAFTNDEQPVYNLRSGETSSVNLALNNPLPAELLKPNTGDFSETKMLVNIGLNVLVKNTQEFALQSSLLKLRLERYCNELEGGLSPKTEKEVQAQWEATMLAYHTMDAAPVGPISDNSDLINTLIYGWPLLNTCAVDTDVVNYSEGAPLVVPAGVNQRGLAALEYLLFSKDTETKCKRSNVRVAQWLAKNALTKKQERCAAAVVLAKDIEVQARFVEAAWNPDGANFTKTLIDSTRYPTTKLAVNAITDSLFSIEKVKDDKLAKVLGLHEECYSDTKKCPENAEHQWSNLGYKAIIAQLEGFRAVFFGASSSSAKAFGLDDYIHSINHTELTSDIERVLDEAIANAKALDAQGTLIGHVETMDVERCRATTYKDNQEPLCHLFQQVREVVTDLKMEVLLTLSLSAPAAYQGDLD